MNWNLGLVDASLNTPYVYHLGMWLLLLLVDRNSHTRVLTSLQPPQMRPAIDNKPPPKFVHLAQNLKKQQMDEERYSQIERDNYLLLDKMSYIMTHPQLLDEKYMGPPVTYGKSLNKEYRKRELMRITEENLVTCFISPHSRLHCTLPLFTASSRHAHILTSTRPRSKSCAASSIRSRTTLT